MRPAGQSRTYGSRGSSQSQRDDSEVTTTESDRSIIEKARVHHPTTATVRGVKQKSHSRPSSKYPGTTRGGGREGEERWRGKESEGEKEGERARGEKEGG